MKKILRYLFFIGIIFTFVNAGMAEDNALESENSALFNKGFSGQKSISDSKFKKTIEEMKARSLTKKQKKIREQVQPNEPMYDSEHLKQFANSQDPDNELSQTLTVMIPVKAYSENGGYIEPGYYKLSCRKVAKNQYVLDLSQGAKRVLTVEANHTQQDLGQQTIQFCNAEIIPNGRIRLMYGSIDLNLVGYLYFD